MPTRQRAVRFAGNALSALGVLMGVVAHAQNPAPTLGQLSHRAWTVRDGAPANTLVIAQSADGFLWLGGLTGLYRFDGVRFERFEPPDGQAMPSMAVAMLHALPDGSLWIGYTLGGVSVLVGGRLTNFGEREGLPIGTITGFARDSTGVMWVSTTTGIARLVNGTWQRVGAERGYPGGVTAALLVDRRGTLWAAEQTGVFMLPRGARRFVRRARTLDIPAGGSGDLREAPDGSVWGQSGLLGLVRLSGPAGEPSPGSPLVAGTEGFTAMIVDRRANAWLYAAPGAAPLMRVPLGAPAGRSESAASGSRDTLNVSRAAGMSGDRPRVLFEDREGNVWMATEGGIGQFRVAKLRPVDFRRAIVRPAIAASDGGAIWVGNDDGTLIEVGEQSVTHPVVPTEIDCAYRDLDGGVWIGGRAGLWYGRGGRFAPVALPPEFSGANIQAIARERDGTLWLSLRGGRVRGVFRRRQGIWQPFDSPLGAGDRLALAIVSDSAGRIWLGYPQDHVVRVRGDSVQFYQAEDGLRVGSPIVIHVRGDRVWVGGESGVAWLENGRFHPLMLTSGVSRGVTGIVETADGELWLNGADGVTRVPAAELRRAMRQRDYRAHDERFDYRDGIEGPAPYLRPVPSAIQGTDGRLWFSSSTGVSWVDPRHIPRNPIVPPVHIRALEADGRRYAGSTRVELPPRTSALTIAYTATSLSVPERVRFRYRLVGSDTTWQDVGTRREAFYTNLGPGSYRFRVIAANDDGLWNQEGAAIDVVIPPTFVQTRAFLALCALVAAGAIGLLALWRQHRVAAGIRARFDATLAERTRIAQELHDTLLQSLTGVALQVHAALRILDTRPQQATEILKDVANTANVSAREARHMVWEMRAPELDTSDLPDALASVARDAIASKPIAFHLAVRGERRRLPHAVEVAALRIGREAILNVLRHASARTVDVTLDFEPRALTMRVRDDGRGMSHADREAARSDGHWGIVGMRERAARVGGTIDLTSSPGGGTVISVVLPTDGI